MSINLGYACINTALQAEKITCNRGGYNIRWMQMNYGSCWFMILLQSQVHMEFAGWNGVTLANNLALEINLNYVLRVYNCLSPTRRGYIYFPGFVTTKRDVAISRRYPASVISSAHDIAHCC